MIKVIGFQGSYCSIPLNRLPANLKRRYLDFMVKRCMNLNQPNFESFKSLRKFVVHELHLMTSDYAQALFKSDDKERTREPGNGRGTVRVCRKMLATSVDSDIRLPGRNQASVVSFGSTNRQRLPNTLPECFLCASRHYLSYSEVLPVNITKMLFFTFFI